MAAVLPSSTDSNLGEDALKNDNVVHSDDILITQMQLTSLEFSVEKILDSVVTRDGSRYYLVKWYDTWVDETSLLLKCQHIVGNYWDSVNQQLNNTTGNSADIDIHNVAQSIDGKVTSEVMFDPLLSLPSKDCKEQLAQVSMNENITQETVLLEEQASTDANKKIEKIEEVIIDHSAPILTNSKNACEVCGKVLSSKKVLRRHVILKHLKNGRHQCPVCNRRFFSNHELTRHMPVHTNVKAHECKVCAKAFKQAGQLYKHLQIHTGEKNFECDICNRKFTQKTNLQNHYSTHAQEKLFQCGECKVKFKHKNSVYIHYKRYHSGNRDSVCVVCDAGFQNKTLLKKHIRDAHGSALFSCTMCPRKFMLKKYLNKHLSKHEADTIDTTLEKVMKTEKEKLHQCSLCNSSFKTTQHLKTHMNVHNDDTMTITCEKCPKKFKWKQSLQRHVRTDHDSEKTENTMETGKASIKDLIDNTDLVKRKHSGLLSENETMSNAESSSNIQRPNECQFCNSTFAKKEHLKSHMQVHSNRKHVCSVCDKTFKWEYSLTRHQEAQHSCSVSRKQIIEVNVRTRSQTQNDSLIKDKVINPDYQHMETDIEEGEDNTQSTWSEFTASSCEASTNATFASITEINSNVQVSESCNKQTFNKISSIRNSVIGIEEKMHESEFPCETCQINYSSSFDLLHHLMNVHKEELINLKKNSASEKDETMKA